VKPSTQTVAMRLLIPFVILTLLASALVRSAADRAVRRTRPQFEFHGREIRLDGVRFSSDVFEDRP